MDYDNVDMKELGKRIQAIRKEKYKSAEKFCENELDENGNPLFTLSSVKKWESGHAEITLSNLLKFCNVFGCEIDYVLGKQKLKTKVATDIQQETGLSAEAVNALIENRSKAHADFIDRYIVKGGEISEAIERLREMQRSGNGNIKHYEFDVTDSFLDLVKEYIKQEDE